MGNRRKTAAQRKLEGKERPSRDYPEPDLPEFSTLAPPDWVFEDRAVAEWHRVVRIMGAVGVLSEADATVLGHYCNLHGRMVAEMDEVTAAMLTQFRLYATEFGLTPASRSRVGGGKKADPNSEFFGGPKLAD